jgi:hypothetical protein
MGGELDFWGFSKYRSHHDWKEVSKTMMDSIFTGGCCVGFACVGATDKNCHQAHRAHSPSWTTLWRSYQASSRARILDPHSGPRGCAERHCPSGGRAIRGACVLPTVLLHQCSHSGLPAPQLAPAGRAGAGAGYPAAYPVKRVAADTIPWA